MTEWDLPSICWVGMYCGPTDFTHWQQSPLEITMTSTLRVQSANHYITEPHWPPLSTPNKIQSTKGADQTLEVSTTDATDAVVSHLSCTDSWVKSEDDGVRLNVLLQCGKMTNRSLWYSHTLIVPSWYPQSFKKAVADFQKEQCLQMDQS